MTTKLEEIKQISYTYKPAFPHDESCGGGLLYTAKRSYQTPTPTGEILGMFHKNGLVLLADAIRIKIEEDGWKILNFSIDGKNHTKEEMLEIAKKIEKQEGEYDVYFYVEEYKEDSTHTHKRYCDKIATRYSFSEPKKTKNVRKLKIKEAKKLKTKFQSYTVNDTLEMTWFTENLKNLKLNYEI